MAEFLGPLVAMKVGEMGNRPLWKLVNPLAYRSDVLLSRVIIPAGFMTDFASVPRVPLAFWLAGDTAHEAAVVHDYLYKRGEVNGRLVSRATADEVFYEAMRVTRIPRWRAWVMWMAVRLGGWKTWKRYREQD